MKLLTAATLLLLAATGLGFDRVVVCEEAYQEG